MAGRRLIGALGLAGVLVWGASARANEVYIARDADGDVVFTNVPVGDRWQPKTRALVAPSKKILEPEQRYDRLIQVYARHYGVSPYLVKAMMKVESRFNPEAVSPAGALGLLQLMPTTAQRYHVQDLFDPEENIAGATRYLRDLMILFDGNVRLALAAYNCGEGRVQRLGRVPAIAETQAYVRKVLVARERYRQSGF